VAMTICLPFGHLPAEPRDAATTQYVGTTLEESWVLDTQQQPTKLTEVASIVTHPD
jgi:hypothetical protein